MLLGATGRILPITYKTLCC